MDGFVLSISDLAYFIWDYEIVYLWHYVLM